MSLLDKFFLERGSAQLVVIDVQEKLCRAMDPEVLAKLTKNISILLDAAAELGIPTIATEQYVKGLGETLPELKEKLPAPALEKMTFSCCGGDGFMEQLAASGRRQVILVGMETHVCVLQTALELLAEGYVVHLVSDAVMSRRKENWITAVTALAGAGAVITSTESVLFQLLRVAGTEAFKKLSKLVR
ncbi:hydrolase [Geomesophilobacter sediminis]|uniref:Hydrolase n=1 Tax=Geomesophilobacter sediminis TaxID=2798584 RepID=A0A8J7M374_9BACT|nr:hydrolase [Geomesophilobacter sediminis]MBJ6727823.1 hydrolase [Geomesophilobacter sediminis]